MSWSWEAHGWRKSVKILLLAATVWPFIYIPLFIGVIISVMALSERAENRDQNICARLDVLQLDRKIKAGEITQLKVRDFEVIGRDKGGCNYQTRLVDESTRKELLADANELVDGRPRVEQITSEPESQMPPALAVGTGLGFMVLMALHFATILLMTAQMPFYIVLAVKNDRLDQTNKIIWIVLFAVVSILCAPVYWYLYIWRRPVPIEPAAPEAI
ncbi:MAG TPA: hypothetical protein VE961_10195 [Pyrinomonadaceae bacterium]|nr:hypothetical protein [Pyrinomonadaceae bacterium]